MPETTATLDEQEEIVFEFVSEALRSMDSGGEPHQFDNPEYLQPLAAHVVARAQQCDEIAAINDLQAQGLINRLIDDGRLERVTDPRWLDHKVGLP